MLKSIFLTASLLLSVLLPGLAQAHTWMTIRIATTEYAPYTSVEMEHDGYMNHIISEAFLETGVEVEFVSLSWDEALEGTINGDYDALSYGYYVRDREDDFWHSEPVTSENLVFYANTDSGPQKWSSLADMKDYKMGITKGYLYNNELAAYIKKDKNIVAAKNDLENFNALVNGDIDVFPLDELTGWYLLHRDFTDTERDKITEIEPILSTVTTHLLVPKGRDNRLTLELFNKGLQELKHNGSLNKFKRLLREGYYQNPEKPVDYDRR